MEYCRFVVKARTSTGGVCTRGSECIITDARGKSLSRRARLDVWITVRAKTKREKLLYSASGGGLRPENNQIRMQFLAGDRYKGSSSEENSLFLRSHPSFKDYFHVRPSAFRWWKDARFNQVNATMRAPPSPSPARALPPGAVCTPVRTHRTSTCARLTTHMNARTRGMTFMCGAHFGNGATVYRPEVSNYRSLSTSAFLADWFEEKCRANFRVTFSALVNEARPSAGCRAFECHKETHTAAPLRISTNIIRRKGWRVARPERLSRCVIRNFGPNRLLVRDDSQTINHRSWRTSSMVKMR